MTQKKCKSCNEPIQFTVRNNLKTYKQKLGYGIDCGCFMEFIKKGSPEAEAEIQKSIIKGKANLKTEKRKKDKAIKDEYVNWKEKLQVKVNLIVRLIDKGLPCLARGTNARQFHGGHIYSVGSNSTMRFNLHNIHRQSAQSNHFQNDDGLLREGLSNEYGYEYMDFISELRATPPLKYSNNDYLDFTKKASKIALELTKMDLTYSLKQRIILRNDVNVALGIYDNEFCEFRHTALGN